ncbi:MAG: 16S rRNA (cytosine(1402)-N(4))-methyltransferase RsmH [Labilithrix sp.]|nr:16S rRNA (cytosine(1402)-N(4))-methyltransferase RsmH [Labilithrix sp.]MCW5811960.1 16S rRNA (cytosine(1402)-N(4))-methyltransferase RsmH [Labilithrix sp.]
MPDFVHETVMLREVVHALGLPSAGSAADVADVADPSLAPASGASGVFVDCTLGGGGHSEGILEASPTARVIALDRDDVALAAARARLARFGERVTFVKTPFGDVVAALAELGMTEVDGLCADLGVSSPQLDDAARGMSFRREGPLDMRMDATSGETALELIARLSDDELADVIFDYGDERRSRRIARSVKRALSDNQLTTTLDLRKAIVRAVGPVRVGGVDPATRTFQALRIAVNNELDQLDELLSALPRIVRPGGRVAILSFHSLEDRLVKRAFQDRESWDVITKKPVVATEEESTANPRARSAKLRAAVRSDGGGSHVSGMRSRVRSR